MRVFKKENDRPKRVMADPFHDIRIMQDLSPRKVPVADRCRARVPHARQKHDLPERFPCRVTGVHRSQFLSLRERCNDQVALHKTVWRLSDYHQRHGHKRIAAFIQGKGWRVSPKRMKRLWCEEGPEVARRQGKCGRLHSHDGPCIWFAALPSQSHVE